MYPKPWEVPKEKQPLLQKNIDFYGRISKSNTKTNLWDNRYRTSPKVYKFYQFGQKHRQEKLVKKDLDHKAQSQQRQLQQKYHLYHKERSHERINSRQVERKMLTFKSNQPGLDTEETQVFGDMAECQDTQLIAKDLTHKRSQIGSFKNPEKGTDPNQQLWSKSRINQSNTNQIKALIQTKTLYKDQDACKHILKQIVSEKEINELEKNWHQHNREKIREKFLQRHEQNIQVQLNAGHRVSYEELPQQDKGWNYANEMSQEENTRSRETLFTINQNFGAGKSPMSEIQQYKRPVTSGYLNVKSGAQTGDMKMQSKSTTNVNQQCFGGMTDLGEQNQVNINMFETQDQTMPIAENEEPSRPTIEVEQAYGASGQVTSQLCAPTSFRVRKSATRHHKRYNSMVSQRIRRQVERLAQPKPEYIPKDPFAYQDFRGLLNADFKDAIQNCFSQQELDKINDETTFSDTLLKNGFMSNQDTGLSEMAKQENTIVSQQYQVFPVPQSLKSLKSIDKMDPSPQNDNMLYKTKSIMSTDALTKQVFDSTGSQGQKIWDSIRNLQQSKGSATRSMRYNLNKNSRPLTAYQVGKLQKSTRQYATKSEALSPSSPAQRFQKRAQTNRSRMTSNPHLNLCDLDPLTEAAHVENQIDQFEQIHNIGSKTANKYPNIEEDTTKKIKSKYFASSEMGEY